MFHAVVYMFLIVSLFSFLLFFPHVVPFQFCMFQDMSQIHCFFSLLKKPTNCIVFIFRGCATALPYCGSQTGPDFAVLLFWQDLGRSGITRCHVSLSAMSQVLSTVEVTEPWAWHLLSVKKSGMPLGILFWFGYESQQFILNVSMLKNHKICCIVYHFLAESVIIRIIKSDVFDENRWCKERTSWWPSWRRHCPHLQSSLLRSRVFSAVSANWEQK